MEYHDPVQVSVDPGFEGTVIAYGDFPGLNDPKTRMWRPWRDSDDVESERKWISSRIYPEANTVIFYYFQFFGELTMPYGLIGMSFGLLVLIAVFGLVISAMVMRRFSKYFALASFSNVVLVMLLLLPPDFAHDTFGFEGAKRAWSILVLAYFVEIILLTLHFLSVRNVPATKVEQLIAWNLFYVSPIAVSLIGWIVFGYDFLFLIR